MISHSSPFGRSLVWLAVSACCIFFLVDVGEEGFFPGHFTGISCFLGPCMCGGTHTSTPSIHHHPTSPRTFPSTFTYQIHPLKTWEPSKKSSNGKGKNHLNQTLHFLDFAVVYIIWVFPKIRVPQNGWFIMENPGVPLFSETSIYIYIYIFFFSSRS